MPARDLGAGDHDIVSDLATERQTGVLHGVFPTVDQRDEPATGRGRRLLGRRTALGADHLGHFGRTHERRVPAFLVLAEPQLVPSDLDLVPVQQWARLHSELHAVDHHHGAGGTEADRHAARSERNDRPVGRVAARQANTGPLEGAEGRFTRRERVLAVAKLQIGHREGETTGSEGGSASVKRPTMRRPPTPPLANGRAAHTGHYGSEASDVSRAPGPPRGGAPGSRSRR